MLLGDRDALGRCASLVGNLHLVLVTTEERLNLKQGVFAMAQALNPGVDPKTMIPRVEQLSDEQLSRIGQRFEQLSRDILRELGLA